MAAEVEVVTEDAVAATEEEVVATEVEAVVAVNTEDAVATVAEVEIAVATGVTEVATEVTEAATEVTEAVGVAIAEDLIEVVVEEEAVAEEVVLRQGNKEGEYAYLLYLPLLNAGAGSSILGHPQSSMPDCRTPRRISSSRLSNP